MSKRSLEVNLASALPALPEPLLVPLAEAARLLGVKMFSIRQLCRQFDATKGAVGLPHRLIGNRWLVPLAAVRAFAAGEVARKAGVR